MNAAPASLIDYCEQWRIELATGIKWPKTMRHVAGTLVGQDWHRGYGETPLDAIYALAQGVPLPEPLP